MLREEQKCEVVDTCMDVAAGVGRFRIVSIITVDHDGGINVFQMRDDSATRLELVGLHRLMAADNEQQMMMHWQDNKRPHSGE